MTGNPSLEVARRVADAVLHEGYVLFPYRASAGKNRYRWQFGVVIPRAQARAGTDESWRVRAECLLDLGAEPDAGRVPELGVMLRALRIRRRTGGPAGPWDEGDLVEVTSGPLVVPDLLAGHRERFALAAARRSDPVTGEAWSTAAVHGGLSARVTRLDRAGLAKLAVTAENLTLWSDPNATRDEVLARSLVGTHLLLTVSGAEFVSLLDPPTWAADAAAACRSEHTYPVLAGPAGARDVVLSAPIILYDHPEIAPESTGDQCDATEIDELLALMVRTMTDDEKRAARRTDPRAAAIVERLDGMPPEVLDRLHGAIRSVHPPSAVPVPPSPPAQPVDLFASGDRSIEEVETPWGPVTIDDLVRLAPRSSADAQDMFAAGRIARVRRIVADVDGETHVGVTVADDPGADLHDWYGRYLWFRPDELAEGGG